MSEPSELTGDASKDRFLAAFCDNMLAMVVSIIAAIAIGDAVGDIGDAVKGVTFVTLYFLYFFLGEGLIGATPGKLVFGLRVRQLSGQRCTWLQAGIRTILKVFEANPLLLGVLPAGLFVLATKRRQRLGDVLAGTVVVSNEKSP